MKVRPGNQPCNEVGQGEHRKQGETMSKRETEKTGSVLREISTTADRRSKSRRGGSGKGEGEGIKEKGRDTKSKKACINIRRGPNEGRTL